MKEKNENVRGYLKKMKNSSFTRMFGATNLRWFEINLQQKIFGYKEGSTDKEFLNSVSTKDISDYNENLNEIEQKYCEWKYGFKVISKSRTFVLYANSAPDRLRWKRAFDIILGRLVITPPKEVSPAKKLPSPPKIDLEEEKRREREIEKEREREMERLRKKKMMEEEEERRRKMLIEEEERKRIEKEKLMREMENMNSKKKGFYDDIGVLVNNYKDNIEKTKHLVPIITTGNKNSEQKEEFLVNEDEFDDWNFYNNQGNLLVESKNFRASISVQQPQNTNKKELDYESFKKNLVLENLVDDRFLKEKFQDQKRKNKEDEERKKKEILEEKLAIEEREKEREKERKIRETKGVEKIKMEIIEKNNLKEKYAPKIDIEKKTKFSIYENVSINNNFNGSVNLKVEGVDLTKRADQKYLNDNLNQPYNIVGEKVGFQRSSYSQSKAVSVDKTSSLKKNLENINFDHERPSENKVNRQGSIPINKVPAFSATTKKTSVKETDKKVVVSVFDEFMNEFDDLQDQNWVVSKNPLLEKKSAVENNYYANKNQKVSNEIPFGEEFNVPLEKVNTETQNSKKNYKERTNSRDLSPNKIEELKFKPVNVRTKTIKNGNTGDHKKTSNKEGVIVSNEINNKQAIVLDDD